MEYYGNKMWNITTDNLYKSKLLMDRQSFDNFSKILEAAEMNFYACVKENKVVVAINKSDTSLCKRLIGKQLADKVSFQDSNKPYSPPEMNVFGSEYKYIPHKRHFKVIGGANTDNSDALLRAAQRLQEMRIQFSGRVYADKTTLTVRSEDFAIVEAAYNEVCRRRSEVYLNMPDEKDMFGTVKYTDIQNAIRIPTDISAERFNSIRTYLDNTGAEYAAIINNGKVDLWLAENNVEKFNDLVIKSDNIRINSEYVRNSGYRTEQITALRKYIDFCTEKEIDIDFLINMIKPEYTNSQNSAIGDLFIQIYSQSQSERFMDSNGYYAKLNDMQSKYDNIVTLKRLCANRDYDDDQILELLNALEADISASVLSELDESYSPEEIREFTELFISKGDSKKTLDNIDGFFERHMKKTRIQAMLDNLNGITEGHSYSNEQRYELLNALMSGVPNAILSEISEDILPEEIRSITETHRFYDTDKVNELFDVDMARKLIGYNEAESLTSAPVGQKSEENIIREHKEDSMDKAIRLINDYCEKEFDTVANFSNMDHVDLAYTTDEETEIPIEVYADLETFRIIKEYDGKIVSEELFESLEDMNMALENLEFNDLVSLSDEEKAIKNTVEIIENHEPKEETIERAELARISDLSVGDIIMYEGSRREVESISNRSISLKDLDAPDFGGILLGTSDVLAYNGWQKDMESKGFEILSKAEKSEPVAEAPEVKKVHQVITNAGFDGGIDDKMEYTTVNEAVKAGRNYLSDGYLGFAVYNQETKKIEKVEGDFPLVQAFNPDILRINGMHEMADEVQALMDKESLVTVSYVQNERPEPEAAEQDIAEHKDFEVLPKDETNEKTTISFSSLDFEKKIPNGMRWKGNSIVEDNTALYWVTQEIFTEADLDKFQAALRDTDIEKAYVIPRDLSGYSFEDDMRNNAPFAVVTKDSISCKDYIDKIKSVYHEDVSKQQEDINEIEKAEPEITLNVGDVIKLASEIEDVLTREELLTAKSVADFVIKPENSIEAVESNEKSELSNEIVWTPIPETEDEKGRATSYSTEYNGKLYWISENSDGRYDIETQIGGRITKIGEEYSDFSTRDYAESAFEDYIEDIEKSFLREKQALISVETFGEEHYFKINESSVDDILKTANTEKPLLEFMEMGKKISGEEYAEIQQSDSFTYSVEMNLDNDTASIYMVNDGKGGISEADRTDSNVTFDTVKISDYSGQTITANPQEIANEANVRNASEERLAADNLPETKFTSLSDEARMYLDFHQYVPSPEVTPWGETQSCYELNKGIFRVSTASHGGIMIRSDIADKILSPEARKIGFREKGFHCYEEDCDACVPERELLDKGIMQVPDYYTDGAEKYNESINEELQEWHTDYWDKREQAIFNARPEEEQAAITGQMSLFGDIPDLEDFPDFTEEENAIQGIVNEDFEQSEKTENDVNTPIANGEKSAANHDKKTSVNKEYFRITNEHLGEGGAKAKFKANIAAIQTLKQLEAENRPATSEEQEVMSRYVGWGGLAAAFDEHNSSWTDEYVQLKELLTDEEYSSARASTLDSFYTSPVIIDGIYEALDKFGFNGGNILEPACGVGNFIGRLPIEMSKHTKFYGTEIDSISGRIAQKLYPNADIKVKGFEKNTYQDGCFDVAVGNVPFGDLGFKDDKHSTSKLHDYFFVETLDKVKDGGIIAFVTSTGTLDKKDESVRKMLSEKADLIGAIRLPSGAFKANAGTEVTSDIIFLQKRSTPQTEIPDWVHIGESENGLPVNKYFADNPDMILGDLVADTNPRSSGTKVVPIEGADLKEQISQAVAGLSARFSNERANEIYAQSVKGTIIPPDDLRNSSFFINTDGRICFKGIHGECSVWDKDSSKNSHSRAAAYIRLRDMTRMILKAQENNCTDEQLTALQGELNRLYDNFYQKYGLLHGRGNKTYFRHDVSYPLVCSLERKYDKDKLVEKSDLFTKRTIKPPVPVTHVDTAQEALIMSMAEHACVDLDYMAQLSDIPRNVLIEELRGEIYPVPELSNGNNIVYQEASEYLSGDIRIKLDNAIKAAKEDPLYSANVAALNKAMPEPLKAGDIDVKLGAIWIEPKYYQQFMYEVFKTPDIYREDRQSKFIWRRKNSNITIEYSDFTGTWYINNKGADNSVNVTQTYGTSSCHAYDILENALNLKEPKLYKTIRENGKEKHVIDLQATKIAQQKCRKIHEAFKAWIFSDPERRSELVNKYNSMYNSIRPREYDGSHLSFPRMNADIQLHSHQKNAIAHALYGGNTLFAHSVGAGKTFEMIATAMESKRLGLCTKSLFAVPNHLTEQIGDDFMRLYPNANVLVATKNDFKKENRRQLVAKIATGNFDAVIIGHSQLGMIPISKERQEAQLNEQINDIVSGIELLKREEGSSYQIKSMERTKKSIQKQLDKLKKEKQDNTVTFEQLGVDKLFVDEAHEFKNLFCATKLQNVAGISSSASQRALDLFMKCRYLDEKTGGKGVVFATGTPISNSVTELHTMMRYLQYDFLKSKNLHHFDNWVSIFGKQKTDYELAPTGNSYRPRTRIASYANLPELMSMFKQCADVKTADMLDLDVPECEMHVVNAEPTEFQKTLVSELADRADEVQKGSVDPSVDNMLRITGDGRKVGLDPRLIDSAFEDDSQSKLNQCVRNVLQIHKDTESEKLTQIIFCDLGVPKGRNIKKTPENAEETSEKSVSETDSLEEECDFCVYEDIKTKLIAGGVPESEIAFIHDAPTEKAKAELFEKVRSGEVRILIGSTGKMGTGTNVQDKLIAMHDLDIPWRPADLEQRMGRMVRQGNENDKVNLYRYVTKGTFDAYSYQLLESKQRFISQIITSKTPARSCEDVDQAALSYSEIKALCTGDERIKELMVLDNEVKDLNIMAADYRNTHYDLEDSIKKYQAQIKSLYKYKNALEVDKKMCEGLPVDPETGKAAFKITIDKKVYTDKTKAAKALEDVARSLAQRLGTDPTPVVIGNLHGFPISINYDPINLCIVGSLNGTAQHSVELTTSYPHNLRKLENLIFTMDSRSEECNEKISRLKIDIEDAEKLLSEPFTRGAELHEKTERLTALRSELNNEAAENLKNNPNKQRTYYFDMARINKLSNNKSASAQTRSKKNSLEKGVEVG